MGENQSIHRDSLSSEDDNLMDHLSNYNLLSNYYRPSSQAREGYVFTGISLTGEGGWRWTAPKVNHLPPGQGQRSQHLPLWPGSKVTTPPPLARVKGHNTSPLWPGSKAITPPPWAGSKVTTPPPLARVKGHNTSPLWPGSKAITPPPWAGSKVTTPPPSGQGQRP